jgi:hypothetical protein
MVATWLCLRLQRGCGVRGWGPAGLGTGAQVRGSEGAEGVQELFAEEIMP